MLLGLTTGHKVGLIVFAAVFVVFALSSAVLIPRLRPSFPGRGLPLFVLATVLLFAGMMTAVVIFGRESKEAGAAGHETTAEATTTTGATPSQAKTIAVAETEFKITLPSTKLAAGSYELDLSNKGKLGHDLVVSGPGVEAKTPVFDPGKSEKLTVTLKSGTYDFYCSVPGHKQAGMDVKVTVS